MSLLDRLAAGATWQVDPDRDREQRKRVRKAARKDGRQGIPANPEQPEVPPFVRGCIDECVRRIADALTAHISRTEPPRKVIATSTAQIADADAKIQEQDQLLADAPRPTSSHNAKEAFRLEQNRLVIARRREEARKTRDEARAALDGANEAVDASFHAYWALRVGEEAHARAVIREDYVAELLRRHHAREALEKFLEPAVERAFAEALREIDEAEKPVRNGQRLSGP